MKGACKLGKTFLIAKLARVIVWMLAGVGFAGAGQLESVSLEIATYIVSAVAALITLYLSWQKDKRLLATTPPK